MTNERWEYHVRHSEEPLTVDQLNELGARGWELAAAMPTAGHYIFKRITTDPPQQDAPSGASSETGHSAKPAAE